MILAVWDLGASWACGIALKIPWCRADDFYCSRPAVGNNGLLTELQAQEGTEVVRQEKTHALGYEQTPLQGAGE